MTLQIELWHLITLAATLLIALVSAFFTLVKMLMNQHQRHQEERAKLAHGPLLERPERCLYGDAADDQRGSGIPEYCRRFHLHPSCLTAFHYIGTRQPCKHHNDGGNRYPQDKLVWMDLAFSRITLF